MSSREACFYCDKPVISDRLERDHAPIPQRHGGVETVPACIACHDLKDRLPLDAWGGDLAVKAFKQAGPLGRILIAKVYGILLDHRAESTPNPLATPTSSTA